MATLTLSASGASTSSGSAPTLFATMALSASGASVSASSLANLVIIVDVLVTQAGLQADVDSETVRVSQSGLQVEAGSEERRVSMAGLQVDAIRQVEVRLSQGGLQADVGSDEARVVMAGLQVDARARLPESTVNCWEFHVFNRFGGYLAYLDGAFGKGYLAQLNDAGSGSFKMHPNDPKATTTNLAIGNLVRVRYRNVDVGAFTIEDVDREIVSQGEETGEVIAVSGRGLLGLLADGVVYPSNLADASTVKRAFSGVSRAEILLTLWGEFTARGGGDLTPDFNTAIDSAGNAWTDTNVLDFKAGQTLLDVARSLCALGLDLTTLPDRTLQAWLSAGDDLQDSVFFREGQNILSCRHLESGSELANVVLGEGQGILVETTDAVSIAARGRQETYLSAGNTSDGSQVTTANTLLLNQRKDPIDALEVRVTAEEWFPFLTYDLGDTVWISVPGEVDAAYRILSIGINERSGPCDLEVVLEVNSLALEYLIKLAKAFEASRQNVQAGAGSATGLAAGDARPVATAAHTHTVDRVLTFYVPGTLSVASHPQRIHAPEAGTITDVVATVGTAPTGASLIVDVNLGGTTIFTTQPNRPTIAAGAQDDLSSTPDVTAVAQNDVFTVDVDQVGSGTAGADLVVQVRYEVTI